jgi:hypothetical protein
MKQPIWMKEIRKRGPFPDGNGNHYVEVSVSYRWWFLPLVWLDMVWRYIRFRVRLLPSERVSDEE